MASLSFISIDAVGGSCEAGVAVGAGVVDVAVDVSVDVDAADVSVDVDVLDSLLRASMSSQMFVSLPVIA